MPSGTSRAIHQTTPRSQRIPRWAGLDSNRRRTDYDSGRVNGWVSEAEGVSSRRARSLESRRKETVQRRINTDRYGIHANPRSAGARVKLTLVRRERFWELNGEPMETAGEVIANIGIVMEHRDREAAKTRAATARKANAARTPGERSEAARKANASRTPEERSEAARKAWATRAAREHRQG